MERLYLGLLGFLLLLLALGLGDGSCPLLIADFRSLVPPCSNEVHISTDDATLVLDGTARTLLGNLLRDALLVHPTEDLGPGDLAGIFALGKERGIFRGLETEYLNECEIGKKNQSRRIRRQAEYSLLPCCHRERKACLCWGRCGIPKRSRSLASILTQKELVSSVAASAPDRMNVPSGFGDETRKTGSVVI